jgi:Fe-S oxidoreductase
MGEVGFETALGARIDEMVDACTRCGKCVEACPSVAPAGITDAKPVDVITGVLDILRTGTGPEASRQWANACTLSGACIKACDYGVNPRFLLAMARIAMAKAAHGPADRRRQGIENFRKLGRDVSVLSRLQLAEDALGRLAQLATDSTADAASSAEPDFVFYTGCNVLKTPHIALLALDIMDALGVTYRVMGGPTHCCGIIHMRAGDTEGAGPYGDQHARQARALALGSGAVVVPELLRAIHRDDPADDRASARLAAVRDDAVHVVLEKPVGESAAAAAQSGGAAACAPPAPRRCRRRGGGRGHSASYPGGRTR